MDFENVPLPAGCYPEGICEHCAGGALFHRPTGTAAAYCEHNLTGAVLPRGRQWVIVPEIDGEAFKKARDS